MHSEPKLLLKEAIKTCLPVFQELAEKYTSPHLVWTRMNGGGWQTTKVPRPDLREIFVVADEHLKQVAKPFADSLLAHYTKFNGLVGFVRLGQINLRATNGIERILSRAIGCLWRLYESFDIDEAAIDALVHEFEIFVDEPTTRFTFRSLLLNFQMSADCVELPQGLRIRRMTDNEMTGFLGGSMEQLGELQPRPYGLHEFCIEGETEELKVFADQKNEPQGEDDVRIALDKAVLSLRTFKEGPIGCDYVHFHPLTFCPLLLHSFHYGGPHVPFGFYTLNVDEFPALTAHAKLVFNLSEPSMELACSRLAEAEMRTKPQDKLVDAVIGMEALLLAGLNTEDRKGELKFRFSLHYSTLFNSPEERYQAFRIAKDLYDHRSAVAHGSTLDGDSFRVGNDKLNLSEVAKRASGTLRHLVRHFLPLVANKPYKNHQFWEQAYFGLP